MYLRRGRDTPCTVSRRPRPGKSGRPQPLGLRGPGVRAGVPTVADRVAQTVVAMHLEERAEPRFHPDSYGYRPGRAAWDAVGVCRQRCRKFDWVIYLDVQKFL